MTITRDARMQSVDSRRSAQSVRRCWVVWLLVLVQGVLGDCIFFRNSLAQDAGEERARPKPTVLIDDWETGMREAALRQQPMLVVMGATWCSWCRKLEAELQKPEAASVHEKWVVVRIDVDAHPDLATTFEVESLPAIRIVRPDQSVVARNEGYLAISELEAWLQQHQNDVDMKSQLVLYAEGAPSESDVQQLIVFLGNRSPALRNAAMHRLTPYRSTAAKSIREILETGKLSQKICARQLLLTWGAPIADLDPWDTAQVKLDSPAMEEWLTKVEGANVPSDTTADRSTDIEAINRFLQRLVADPSESSFAEGQEMGASILPSLRQRLEQRSEGNDAAMQILWEQYYRILASDKLRVQQLDRIKMLASPLAETRRAAAGKLLGLVTTLDLPFVDALSQDADAMVRELSIPTLQNLGALIDKNRIQRFLEDQNPSVRTAILREITEHANDQALDSLMEFIEKEHDENLLVYATKALGNVKSKKKIERGMIGLLQNPSWRVRAAAIDTLQEWLKHSNSSRTSPLTAEIVDALFRCVDDEDKFVASKANELTSMLVSPSNVASLSKFLLKRPEKMETVLEPVLNQEPLLRKVQRISNDLDTNERDAVIEQLGSFAFSKLKSDDLNERRNAVSLLAYVQPQKVFPLAESLLDSEDEGTRIATMKAIVLGLIEARDAQIRKNRANQKVSSAPSDKLVPWFAIPEELEKSHSSDVRVESDAQVTESPSLGSGLLDFFFGGRATTKEEIASNQDAVKDESKPVPLPNEDLAADLFGISSDATPRNDTKNSLNQEEIKSVALTTGEWWSEWRQTRSNLSRNEWVQPVFQKLDARWKDFSDDRQKAASVEYQWICATLLALGYREQELPLYMGIRFERAENDAKVDEGYKAPSLEMVLPWISVETRIRHVSKLSLEGPLSEASLRLFIAATKTTDLEIFDTLLSKLHVQANDPDFRRQMLTLSIRSLLGEFPISSHVYSSYPSNQQSGLPSLLRSRTAESLRTRFLASPDAQVRNGIMSVLATIDREFAIKCALGFIAQCDEDEEALDACLELVFSESYEKCTPRAIRLLEHPVRRVQWKAVEYLATFDREHGFKEGNWILGYTYDNIPIPLPHFWFYRKPISTASLSEMANSQDKRAPLARILLLATKAPDAELSDFHHLPRDTVHPIQISAALSYGKRVDPEAIAYYRKTLESITDTSDATLFYQVLRQLDSPETIELKSSMRKKYGTEIISFR